MANILTGIRILCAILILRFPAFSDGYYFFCLLGGFTDAIDGTVARKTGKASNFGMKFDTVADTVFAVAVSYKLIRSLYFPLWLISWIGLIALLKIGSHLAGYCKYHELKTVHSALNKVCGGATFLVTLLIGGQYAWQAKLLLVISVCILTSAAAIAEAFAILRKQP